MPCGSILKEMNIYSGGGHISVCIHWMYVTNWIDFLWGCVGNVERWRLTMLKRMIKKILRRMLGLTKGGRNLRYGCSIYSKMQYNCEGSKADFVIRNRHRLWVADPRKGKVAQLTSLIQEIEIEPVENDSFFYSIDWFKTLPSKNIIFDNYTVDYQNVISSSLGEKKRFLINKENDFSANLISLINALHDYYVRMCNLGSNNRICDKSINAVGSLFERPAHTFFEGLQRILFVNQFLWQTGHRLNGLGHLDWILIELYRNDIKEKRMTEKQAHKYIKDFFQALHVYFHIKSNVLLGDTGQIIILGGMTEEGKYTYNELTELFIKVSMELKLPDPKVLLRCSYKMPDELLGLALKCISTGIGAPFISNDDAVIPALISYGYDAADAYKYATAACWEPLIPDCSCDQCNVALFNFVAPFMEMVNSSEFNNVGSIYELLDIYGKYLSQYTEKVLKPFVALQFEEDPLLSLLSDTAMEKQQDITQGGAKYQNLGLTSVGMGTVVNSILNIRDIVFTERRYTLQELNTIRQQNFEKDEVLRLHLKKRMPCYGCDDIEVINLTKQIMDMASKEFDKYRTKSGGRFKLGLSAPSYVDAGKDTEASFDGRKSGEPFSVHISASNALPTTELLHFAMQLDYTDNRVNGNVIDFIVSPDALNKNFNKYLLLLKAGLKGGIFQLQMNVVSSDTLIAARTNPEMFPDLVVRVWGFSAYFNDLPDEYKQVLIERALESEKAS